jgi:hypothetical protein
MSNPTDATEVFLCEITVKTYSVWYAFCLCIARETTNPIRGDKPRWEVSMAAIAPPLAMITIIAIIFYLARRSAYKKK